MELIYSAGVASETGSARRHEIRTRVSGERGGKIGRKMVFNGCGGGWFAEF